MNTNEIYYDDPVSRACAKGDIERFKQQLASGADINQIDNSQFLIELDINNKETIHKAFEILRSKGINTQFLSPLGIAIRTRNKALLELILNNGGDINKAYHAAAKTLGEEDDVILSGFEFAIREGYYEGMKIIERHQGAISLSQERINNLLFSALPQTKHIRRLNSKTAQDKIEEARKRDSYVINDSLAIIDHLIDRYGADINALNTQGLSLLHCAGIKRSDFYGDDGRVVRHLLMRGCNPNTHIDKEKYIPMDIYQVEDQLTEMGMGSLFSYINDPDRQSRSRLFMTTPLIYGCYNGDAEFVKILLEDNRTDPTLVDMNGNDAQVAVMWGRKDNCFGDDEKFNAIESALSKAIKVKTGLSITFSSPGIRLS